MASQSVCVSSQKEFSGNEAANRAAEQALHSSNAVVVPYAVSEIGGLVVG